MSGSIDNIRDRFVQSAGNLGESLGVSRVVSQLYALLYISDELLTLDDMCGFLRISKGNACMNIKYLIQWGAVEKVWVKGSRKDHYRANPDIPAIITERLKEGMKRRLGEFIKGIEGIDGMLDEVRGNDAEKYRGRIREITKLYGNAEKVIGLLAGFAGKNE